MSARLCNICFLILLGLAASACNPSSSGRDQDGAGPVLFDPNTPVVSARISGLEVRPGDAVEIEITIDKMPPTEGGGLSLRFDPSVLRIDGIELDPAWNFGGRVGMIDNAAGTVTDILFASFDSPAGSVKVGKLNATALAAGRSVIELQESIVNPFSSAGKPVVVRFENGELEVN